MRALSCVSAEPMNVQKLNASLESANTKPESDNQHDDPSTQTIYILHRWNRNGFTVCDISTYYYHLRMIIAPRQWYYHIVIGMNFVEKWDS